jgi:hypothetical protein
MGRHPWPLEPCGAASRSARPRVCRYALAPCRASPAAARRRAGRAGGKLGARPRAPPPTCGATRRPAVVSLSRFLRVLSRLSCFVYDLGYTIPYNGLRRALPYASRLTHRAANTNRAHTRGTIFSHLCTQGVHRRLSTFEYARPRSAWISHDYIPPPAANTLQSR